MKKIIALSLALIMLFFSLTACSKNEDKNTVYVKMTVWGYGNIVLMLDREAAPITVDNFVKLVNEGFYNGLTFHRVISNFMIQGGDPAANGSGGSDKKIKGEFSANGYDNPIKHERGVISMARGNDYNSASSQFFICNTSGDSVSHLDGNYAAFGYVIAGMNVVDLITSKTAWKATDNNGSIKKADQPVISEMKVIDKAEVDHIIATNSTLTDSTENNNNNNNDNNDENNSDNNSDNNDTNRYVYVRMSVKDYGDIILKLDSKAAPITVANFVKLVNEGFYNGLTFHRVIENFVIQGGDPLGNGMGGSDEKIIGEFAANGYYNPIKHERGVISMARASAYDSASSQFFICNTSGNSVSHLDGNYAAFGWVISGIEIVDRITSDTAWKATDHNGSIAKSDQVVISEVVVITEEDALS